MTTVIACVHSAYITVTMTATATAIVQTTLTLTTTMTTVASSSASRCNSTGKFKVVVVNQQYPPTKVTNVALATV